MEYTFKKATLDELPQIWEIIKHAILRRKQEGSTQWQDGYPNPDVLRNDIGNGFGYVLKDENNIVGYTAIIFNDEPAYANISGKWLSDGDFVVLHRIAIASGQLGKGLAKKIFAFTETIAVQNKVFSVKVDTNFDNVAMLKILADLDYTYCGEVLLRGGVRKAFEKQLG